MVGFHSIEFKALLAKQSVKMTCFRILLVFNTDVIYAFKSFPFFFYSFIFPCGKGNGKYRVDWYSCLTKQSIHMTCAATHKWEWANDEVEKKKSPEVIVLGCAARNTRINIARWLKGAVNTKKATELCIVGKEIKKPSRVTAKFKFNAQHTIILSTVF